MNNEQSNNYENLYQLIHDIAQQFDPSRLQSMLDPICESSHIVRIDGSIFIPESPLQKEGETKRSLPFSNGRPFDDAHKLSNSFVNDRLDYMVTASLYWETDFDPDEELLKFYDAILCLMYMFQSRNGVIMMLKKAVNFDHLTGLVTKHTIASRYDGEVPPDAKTSKYAFFFINIENMKYYNKAYGSEAGDAIIRAYAHSLKRLIDDEEFITHPGGDNFCVTVKKEHIEYLLKHLAHIPVSGIKELNGKTIYLSCWTGISKDISEPLPFNARLYQASVAMQMAKNSRSQKVMFYSEQMEERSHWAREVITGFPQSIAKEEYVPFYQPKVNIPTGEIIGLEALVRWFKDGQMIPPAQFLPILEQDDLISELDIYMLDKACCDIRKWLDEGINVPRVSVNLSRRNLYTPDIVERILDTLKKHSVPAQSIEIEITETTTLEEFNRLIKLAKMLHENDIRVSIDDFGTGYSSLSMLKDVYADIVKIDKTFIDDCLKEQRSYILIKSIIALAQELKMDIISEGVETSEQAAFLMGVGCKNAQGFLYSKPVPFDEITPLLQSGKIEK